MNPGGGVVAVQGVVSQGQPGPVQGLGEVHSAAPLVSPVPDGGELIGADVTATRAPGPGADVDQSEAVLAEPQHQGVVGPGGTF